MEPMHILLHTLNQWSPHFGTRDQFNVDNFSTVRSGGVGGDGFGMIQAHYIYCALYFYYNIKSTSDHQALDSGGWGLLF